jgi:hypothetical protein
MEHEDKAKELVENFMNYVDGGMEDSHFNRTESAKTCAIIAVKNEYHSLREMLFNLRACGVIESGKVYLSRLQGLIDEEKEVIETINNFK